MEIERKFLISKENLPADLDAYPHHKLEQGYLSTAPVVRIRKEDDNYYLTYKSKGLMTREEYNLSLIHISSRVTTTGTRPINSGIRPNLIKSSGITSFRISPTFLSSLTETSAPKPKMCIRDSAGSVHRKSFPRECVCWCQILPRFPWHEPLRLYLSLIHIY